MSCDRFQRCRTKWDLYTWMFLSIHQAASPRVTHHAFPKHSSFSEPRDDRPSVRCLVPIEAQPSQHVYYSLRIPDLCSPPDHPQNVSERKVRPPICSGIPQTGRFLAVVSIGLRRRRLRVTLFSALHPSIADCWICNKGDGSSV
jgi:hypothetical protein